MNPMVIEIFGYLASGFVALSLVMTRIVRLRILNLIGSGLFVIYGIILSLIPIVITNGFILIVNLVHLVRLFRKRNLEQEGV